MKSQVRSLKKLIFERIRQKLKKFGYKRFKKKKSNTLLKLSEGGRKVFEEYRKKLTQILGSTDN